MKRAWSKAIESGGKVSGSSKKDDLMVETDKGVACQLDIFRRRPSRRGELGREEYPIQPFSKNWEDSCWDWKMESVGSFFARLASTSSKGEP